MTSVCPVNRVFIVAFFFLNFSADSDKKSGSKSHNMFNSDLNVLWQVCMV